jgi:tetratricopeptide (TPR) repeat protein
LSKEDSVKIISKPKPGVKIGKIMRPKGTLVKVKVRGKKIISCKECKSPITNTNQLFSCLSCGKKFCSKCESKIIKQETFFDGMETHKLDQITPLCESCYKININKQMEKITMHRRFKQLHDTLPPKSEVWISTGERFKDSNLFYLTAMCFNEAIKLEKNITSKIVKIWEDTGHKLIKESRIVEAVQCFDEALLLDGNLEEVWLERAKTLDSLKRVKEALASYNKVIGLNPKNVEAWSRRGLLLATQKDIAGSKKCFEQAINLNPNEELVWQFKGKSHLIMNEPQEAITAANQSLKINPKNEESLIIKCNGLLKLNKYEDAFDCSEQILKFNPDNVNGLKFMADALVGLEKFDDALFIYNQALGLDPNGDYLDKQELQEKVRKLEEDLVVASEPSKIQQESLKTELTKDEMRDDREDEVKKSKEAGLKLEEKEKKRKEDEKKRFEEERQKKLEEEKEKKQKEDEKKRLEEERQKKLEEEKEKKQKEDEKKRFEEERQKKLEEEKEKKQKEDEKKRFEEERQKKLEEEKEKKQKEDEKKRLEEERQKKLKEEEEKFDVKEKIPITKEVKEKTKDIIESQEEDKIINDKGEEKIDTGKPERVKHLKGIDSSIDDSLDEQTLINELNSLFNDLKDPDKKSEIDNEEIKSKIKDYSKLIKRDLNELKSSGAVISTLVAQYKEAGSKFKEDNYIEALQIIIEILKEKEKLEKEFLDAELKKLSTELDKSSNKYPVEKLKEKLIKTKARFNENNVKGAMTLILELKKQMELTEKYYPKAKKLLELMEQKINKIKEAGYNTEKPVEIFSEMKSAFSEYDFKKLPKLKNECLTAIETSRDEYKNLLEKIRTAHEKLIKMKEQKIDIKDCNKLLKKAKRFLMRGDYEQASQLTKDCLKLSDEKSVRKQEKGK